VHIPAKTTTVYDTNPPIEITQKQSLAMSNFLFSGRPVTTLLRHSDMDLSFPIPVIGKIGTIDPDRPVKCEPM
jgi:hypothetical protein